MHTEDTFKHWFSPEILRQLFWKKIRYKCSPGLDRVGIVTFTEDLENQISLINRKVLNGTYSFTKYNELLISKGRFKEPRCVSRPTIRDKLTLCALHGCLQEIYADVLDNRLIHSKVNEIINNIPNFTHYVKIDIVGFYPSINHEMLSRVLSEKVPESIVQVVNKAITTPTVSRDYNSQISEMKPSSQGVPEGLSISNLLANIFLKSVDTHFHESSKVSYCRYVDDILILVNESDVDDVKCDIVNKLTDLKLKVHDFGESDKSDVQRCDTGFSYLGYYYCSDMISVKDTTIDRFEHSLERMFSDYKKEENSSNKDKLHNIDMFAWKLNLKIAGCVYNSRKYGWMFYYSQINDLTLLRHFDWLVEKLYSRYNIPKSQIEIKSFFKTYHEIKFNLSHSSYFYNVDKMSREEIEAVIRDVFHYLVPAKKEDVEKTFYNVFNTSLRALERDVQFFS